MNKVSKQLIRIAKVLVDDKVDYHLSEMRKQITDQEVIYYFKNKYYEFALYIYYDDDESIYLSDVQVYQQYRKKRYGNKLLQQAEKIAKKMNRKNIYLICKKESFVYEWYKRIGYKDFQTKQDMIWLKKTL